jgi:hypothetical protein
VSLIWEERKCHFHSITIRTINFQTKTVVPALNWLFDECRQLEYLYISEGSPIFTEVAHGLKLPPQLRYLAIYDEDCFTQSLLTEETCKAMAGSLRGLRLSQHRAKATLLPHLRLFTNLTYLGVEVSPANESSLLSAFSSMPNLRALEMTSVGKHLLEEFPVHCPKLEHLSLTTEPIFDVQWSLDEVSIWLDKLKSVTFDIPTASGIGNGSRQWPKGDSWSMCTWIPVAIFPSDYGR